jgi:hypothetical protein
MRRLAWTATVALVGALALAAHPAAETAAARLPLPVPMSTR